MIFLESVKKLLNKKGFRKLNYILNFSQKVTENFIIETARKEIKPGSKILDAGAGTLKYKKYFQDCIYKTQDFKQYGEIDYVCDIIDIPVEMNSFDIIICTEVFEHIPRPDLAVKEFSRILKPNGVMYIISPLNSGIHQAPHHYYGGFSKFWYSRFLNKYNFEEIEIRKKGGFFVFYGQETWRSALYFIKSKKWRYKIFSPMAVLWVLVSLPIFHFLDKKNIDKDSPSYEITMGYLVKAKRK